MKRLFALALSCFFLNNAFSQIAKGDRILAYQVDMTENMNYDSAFAYAQQACMESIHLAMTWSSINPDTTYYDSEFMNNILGPANIYYPAFNTLVELQLAPLNTNVRETPKDLNNKKFSDPVLINRFKQSLDSVFSHLPDLKLSALNIGNEHNILMGSDPVQYAEYQIFLDSVVPYAKQKYFDIHGEDLLVGTTFTLVEMIEPNQAPLCQYVNQNLDIISVTYYPQNSTEFDASKEKIDAHLDTLISQYPGKKIYLAECGYASSSVLGASEELQATFFSNFFSSWDERINEIKYATLFKTTEWSQQDVDTLATYYGLENIEFLEFLRTLGLRTYPGDGTNKLAYDRILCELKARNWCGTSACTVTGLKNEIISSIDIFPNPAKNMIMAFTDENTIETLTVYNHVGQELLSTDLDLIDISSLQKGIYTLEVLLKNGHTERQSFIKE